MDEEPRHQPPSLITGFVDFLCFFLGYFVCFIIGIVVTWRLIGGRENFATGLCCIAGGVVAGAIGGTQCAKIRFRNRSKL
jgi:hypothetical protein